MLPAPSNDRIEYLTATLREFATARDWNQFHTPKNLAMALAAEAGELLEIFQWLTPEASSNLPPEKLLRAKEEIGDIQIYLARLADQLGIDPVAAAEEKVADNQNKYPVDKARGNAKKYTEF
jgi:NTP pyrophosphatase (non-canonical NTP hydrolase)